MQKYSPFFQTLYDQQEPVGQLGRGTHYSILRAIVFHDEDGKPIKNTRLRNADAHYHDFAVIWDEDHDKRIIDVIEKIYADGLLACCALLGERKGGITVISKESQISKVSQDHIRAFCDDLSDPWAADFGTFKNPLGIINDKTEKVIHYIKNIDILWNLGLKPISHKDE